MVENIDRPSQIKDQEVCELPLAIPTGKVSTYCDIANVLGRPQAVRLIGNILKRNPIHVPCHRIVKSNEKLGGYIYEMSMKKEGIKFQNDDNLRHFDRCRMDLKRR